MADSIPKNPPKITEREMKAVAQCCRLGALDTDIAKALGISRATLHRWRKAHPEFDETIRLAKDEATDMVEAMLFTKAIGYKKTINKAFQFQGEPVIVDYEHTYEPDTTSIIFYLKNRRPELWRDRPENRDDGEEAQPLNIKIEVAEAVKDVKITKAET